MKCTPTLAVVAFVILTVSCPALAQTRGARHVAGKTNAATAEAVNIRDAFGFETPAERWSLEDPLPVERISFSGKPLTFAERQINASVSAQGERQLMFPISWFAGYEGQQSDLKYVVIRYRDGKACSILAEYQPNRVALPKEEFQRHPDGTSFYSDVATVRQNGLVYYKQAISKGVADGKGGLYVDSMLMYCAAEKPLRSTASNRQP